MRDGKRKTLVAVPCFNEEKTIGTVIEGLRKALPDAEIRVYNDSSTDRTREIAEMAADKVVFVSRLGKGFAMRQIFSDAASEGFESLLITDGDDTYDPAGAVELADAALFPRADMILGVRTIEKTRMSLPRKLGNRYLNEHYEVPDALTGMRSFSRRFIERFPAAAEGFETEVEMDAFARGQGLTVWHYPVAYKDRPEGSYSKLRPFHDGVRILKAVREYDKRYKKY